MQGGGSCAFSFGVAASCAALSSRPPAARLPDEAAQKLPPLQVHLTPDRAQQWGTFWMLTGAESLCVTALGLPVSPGRSPAAQPPSASTLQSRQLLLDSPAAAAALLTRRCLRATSLQIRMRPHLPLQLAALGAVLWNIPRMCSEVRPCAAVGQAALCLRLRHGAQVTPLAIS